MLMSSVDFIDLLFLLGEMGSHVTWYNYQYTVVMLYSIYSGSVLYYRLLNIQYTGIEYKCWWYYSRCLINTIFSVLKLILYNFVMKLRKSTNIEYKFHF